MAGRKNSKKIVAGGIKKIIIKAPERKKNLAELAEKEIKRFDKENPTARISNESLEAAKELLETKLFGVKEGLLYPKLKGVERKEYIRKTRMLLEDLEERLNDRKRLKKKVDKLLEP